MSGEALTKNPQQCAPQLEEVTEQLAELGTKTKDQVATLEEALADALQQSLSSLGQQLTALSEAFVEDYTPLTNKLRQIVQMAQ